MADNVEADAGSGGATFASDDIGGVHYPRTKVVWGADGAANDTSATDPLPVVQTGTHTVTATQATAANLNVTEASAAAIAASLAALDNAVAGNEFQVDVLTLPAIPAGTNNIGDVDVLTIAAGDNNIGNVDIASIAAGDNNIGNVDIVSVPAPLSTTGTGTEATALRVTVATDSTGVLSVDDNGGALTVDNGGTFAVQVDGSSLTALQLIDDIVYVDDTATHATGTTKGALIMAAATPTDSAISANDIGAVAMTTDRKLHVAVMDALPAGTAAIGKLAANSGVDIGDVDVTSIVMPTGASAAQVQGTVAHDSGIGQNPVRIGATAESSPKGITLVTDGDVTNLYADLDGILITKNATAWGDLISERVSNTDGASSAFSTFDNAANTRNYITSVTVHNAHASTNGYVDLRDGTAGSILWTFPLPATGGATHNFNPPLRQPTAATALAYDVSAAITTIYLSVNGFKSKS